MKINILDNPQSLKDDTTILYAPELELPEAVSVEETCYPAVRFSQYHGQKFFFILASEIGRYEEHTRYAGKGDIYGYFGGKKNLEQKFQQIYNKQMQQIRPGS